MIVNNPQDLTPILAAMKSELKADVETANTALANSVTTDTQQVINDLAALTTVNGEINTEVQAINTHTSNELGKLALSPIKAVHHISMNGSGFVDIPEVDINKTFVVYNLSGRGSAYLYSATKVAANNVSSGTMVYIEVIEYA
ncbi:hypothetical protein ACPV5J_19140 [Vibrio rotiferianus]|uniref:hypothetical protein n=1 Tax=Vibrio rotiferianus TaxID=190895 RepID=UPI00406A7901